MHASANLRGAPTQRPKGLGARAPGLLRPAKRATCVKVQVRRGPLTEAPAAVVVPEAAAWSLQLSRLCGRWAAALPFSHALI